MMSDYEKQREKFEDFFHMVIHKVAKRYYGEEYDAEKEEIFLQESLTDGFIDIWAEIYSRMESIQEKFKDVWFVKQTTEEEKEKDPDAVLRFYGYPNIHGHPNTKDFDKLQMQYDFSLECANQLSKHFYLRNIGVSHIYSPEALAILNDQKDMEKVEKIYAACQEAKIYIKKSPTNLMQLRKVMQDNNLLCISKILTYDLKAFAAAMIAWEVVDKEKDPKKLEDNMKKSSVDLPENKKGKDRKDLQERLDKIIEKHIG